jgi:hypothetical protein
MRFFSPILGDDNPKDAARTAPTACLSSDEAKSDLGSIMSDIQRFLRIGFFVEKGNPSSRYC